jgi:hypothetical protein
MTPCIFRARSVTYVRSVTMIRPTELRTSRAGRARHAPRTTYAGHVRPPPTLDRQKRTNIRTISGAATDGQASAFRRPQAAVEATTWRFSVVLPAPRRDRAARMTPRAPSLRAWHLEISRGTWKVRGDGLGGRTPVQYVQPCSGGSGPLLRRYPPACT